MSLIQPYHELKHILRLVQFDLKYSQSILAERFMINCLFLFLLLRLISVGSAPCEAGGEEQGEERLCLSRLCAWTSLSVQ